MPRSRNRLPRSARRDHRAVERWIGNRTLAAAAARLGCSQGHLSNFLLGKRELSCSTIKRWAVASGIPERVFLRAKLEAAA